MRIPPIGVINTYLCAGLEEELVRIHAIADGATDEGEPMEDHRGFMGIFEQDLSQNIEDNGHAEKSQQCHRPKQPY